jgi:hypothetical protein
LLSRTQARKELTPEDLIDQIDENWDYNELGIYDENCYEEDLNVRIGKKNIYYKPFHDKEDEE